MHVQGLSGSSAGEDHSCSRATGGTSTVHGARLTLVKSSLKNCSLAHDVKHCEGSAASSLRYHSSSSIAPAAAARSLATLNAQGDP